MTRAIASHRAAPANPAPARVARDGYFEQSASPLTSLVFLLPLLILYEVGTRLYASDPLSHAEMRIRAFDMMQAFFSVFGATGKYLPALAVVGILLTWHIARNDAWTVQGRYLLFMAAESIALSLPLVAAGDWFAHWRPLMGGQGEGWPTLFVLCLGAGIYEELLFRLAAFTLLSALLIDLMKIPHKRAVLLMVLVSALMFSEYHYLGSENFLWRTFAFRTAAGIYLSLLFVWRGFGISAGAHAAYDIIVVARAFCATS